MTNDKGRRNSYLTDGMYRFLCAIRDSEDGYAIQEGLEVWAGDKRFHSKTVIACLRLCLISEDPYASAGMHLWALNNDGFGVLKNPQYVPSIVKAMKEKAR